MHVDVWRLSLSADPALVDRLFPILSADERARANRFATPELRMRYVVAHAALRTLLGRALGRNPASLAFSHGSAGKPLLPDGALDFNMSHAGDLALYGITRGTALGVDVEECRTIDDQLSIARRFFAANEYAELAALPQSQQTPAFFRCWTRKEAYVKALGDGLQAPLDAFEVTLRPGEAAAVRHVAGDPEAAARWRLHHLEPAPGYIGAVAAAAPIEVGPLQTLSAEELLTPAGGRQWPR
jgi:4'-phosphopantetheinyl transferase